MTLTPRMRLAGALAAGVLGTLYLLTLNGTDDSPASDPQPACAAAEAAGSQTVSESCLEDVGNWCARNHPRETSGECIDIVFGTMPGPFKDS